MSRKQDEADAKQERQEAQQRAATQRDAARERAQSWERAEHAHAASRAAEHEPEPVVVRGPADVLADMQALAAGFPRLSPSGVETAASQLAALVGELKALMPHPMLRMRERE